MTSPERISLYIHIPFCETKCPYCDFNTYAKIESLMPSYTAALCNEIRLWGDKLGHPVVHTIFFGGGTPSYLPSEDIRSVMEAVGSAFDVEADSEVTIEANPGDFTPAKLKEYLDCGVNRLSIGVQSFDDELLKALGRRHSSAGAVEAYRMALDAGFDNVSIDLMYGLPYQKIEQWQNTLDRAMELNPSHLSMYCLTLEGGTPMEQWVEIGKMPEPDADLAADMYLMAQDVMRAKGYRHYEISNWSRDGLESRHNVTYWRNEPYLGVGPGAHSYLSGQRFFNIKSPREYVKLLQEVSGSSMAGEDIIKSIPVVESVEVIEKPMEMAETMMMGLRLDTGISIDKFAKRFEGAPSEYYAEILDELMSIGLLETSDGFLRLTRRGRMFGNEVFSRFFA